jgi:6-phosphogluconolactonase
MSAIILITVTSNLCENDYTLFLKGKCSLTDKIELYLFDFNQKGEKFNLLVESEKTSSPPYFCISEKKSLIYSLIEIEKQDGSRGDAIITLKYNKVTNIIEKINDFEVSREGGCHISLSNTADFLFTANYSGGFISVIKLDDKGIPATITDTVLFKKEGAKVSHPHMISPDPAGKRIYVTDLGLDRIVIYDFDPATGKLLQISDGIFRFPNGTGPRHFVFNSDGTKMYTINELNSTMSVFNVDANGELILIQTISTLRADFTGKSYCADVHMGMNGEFIYGSNRGENSIVTFKIGVDGTLTLAGHIKCGGDWPRNFVIDPLGKYIFVGNERSGNISFFEIDENTGLPIEPGNNFDIPAPVCLKVLN